ncbi:hypothetical protein HDU83_005842 [Entophlyctis luteolus]|nr:hypothetical protein HDU83_005842 [Entophlyctis luteolus]
MADLPTAVADADIALREAKSAAAKAQERLDDWIEKNPDHTGQEPGFKARVAGLKEKEAALKEREEYNLRLIGALTAGGKDVDRTTLNPLIRSSTDQFIIDNHLDLQRTEDVLIFLKYKIESLAPFDPDHPYQASFAQNCLEHRLDRRQTTYQLDDENNVKLLLLVSGAGKTRQLLEMLTQKFGYYFVCHLQHDDFGSGDLVSCYAHSARTPEKAEYFIQLLYFVRAFVCDYLVGLGYNSPSQILLAQLHPVQFFGWDVFRDIFNSLAERSSATTIGRKIQKCFDFVAIDEIQKSVESERLFQLPGSFQKRPFYSPLVYFSKHLGKFTNFIVSGTGINYQIIEELAGTGVMKMNIITRHSTISGIKPLDKRGIALYIRLILSDYNFEESIIERFVDAISSFELCHGRARFIAFILDSFCVSENIELVLNEFVSNLTNVYGDLFPLKLFQRDLEERKASFSKVLDVDTLGRIVRDGIIEYMMNGKAILHVKGQLASDAVRYGLGFCKIDQGIIYAIAMTEDAIVECLRYLVPFSDLVEALASQLLHYPKPPMIGIVMEYLVAYALVANLHPESRSQIKTFPGTILEYLESSNVYNEVFFPDHCCGADIFYKDGSTMYIMQVKFVDKITKQERVHACHTTDPQYFYWNRKNDSVLRGFESRRNDILDMLKNMTCRRLAFLHTTTKTTLELEDVTVINQDSEPKFFDNLDVAIWPLLNNIRDQFNKQS